MDSSAPSAAACPLAMPMVPEATPRRRFRGGHCYGILGFDPGLAFAFVALALGLAAVVASFTIEDLPVGRGQHRAGARVNQVPSAGSTPVPGHNSRRPLAWSGESIPWAAFDELPQPRASGPPKSPLYPQNSVALWDRIRVSSPRDRQAFLFGTAIQVHASAVAATPGWQD